MAIEKVHHKFTKRLPGFYEYSYTGSYRLSLLGLPSLELHRLHFGLK